MCICEKSIKMGKKKEKEEEMEVGGQRQGKSKTRGKETEMHCNVPCIWHELMAVFLTTYLTQRVLVIF